MTARTNIMPEISYTLEGGCTQSLLAAFYACKRRAYYMLNRWEKEGQISQFIDYGNVMHYLLELYHSGKEIPDPDVVTKICGIDFSDQKALDNVYKAFIMFDLYKAYYKSANSKLKFISTEEVFKIEFPKNSGLFITGKFDGVIEKGKSIWLFETKTRSVINEETSTMTLGYDFQNLFYLCALRKRFPNRHIGGVIYNIIRNPGNYRGKKETVDEFRQRLRDVLEEKISENFMRFEVQYSASDLDEHGKIIIKQMHEFLMWIREFNQRSEFRHISCWRNSNQCTGKYTCPFIQACSSDGVMVGYKQREKQFAEL